MRNGKGKNGSSRTPAATKLFSEVLVEMQRRTVKERIELLCGLDLPTSATHNAPTYIAKRIMAHGLASEVLQRCRQTN